MEIVDFCSTEKGLGSEIIGDFVVWTVGSSVLLVVEDVKTVDELGDDVGSSTDSDVDEDIFSVENISWTSDNFVVFMYSVDVVSLVVVDSDEEKTGVVDVDWRFNIWYLKGISYVKYDKKNIFMNYLREGVIRSVFGESVISEALFLKNNLNYFTNVTKC